MITEVKYNHIETVYTLEDARKIIYAEERRRKKKYQIEARYFAKQRLCGFLLIAIGSLATVLFHGEFIAFTFIAWPLGVFLMATKHHVMMFDHMEDSFL